MQADRQKPFLEDGFNSLPRRGFEPAIRRVSQPAGYVRSMSLQSNPHSRRAARHMSRRQQSGHNRCRISVFQCGPFAFATWRDTSQTDLCDQNALRSSVILPYLVVPQSVVGSVSTYSISQSSPLSSGFLGIHQIAFAVELAAHAEVKEVPPIVVVYFQRRGNVSQIRLYFGPRREDHLVR